MALIGNNSLFNQTPFKQFGGGVSLGYPQCIVAPNSTKNRFFGGYVQFNATPIGYTPPGCWVPAKISGGLASLTQLTAKEVVTNAPLALGIGLVANGLVASITTTNAFLALIVEMQAALTASGTITNAQLAIILEMQASISATGSITNANLSNILGLAASLVASGSLTTASAVTLMNLSANISSNTPLSPESLAASVWNATASSYLVPGTTGKALSDAGGAGNPWSSIVNDNQSPGTFGERIKKLLTTGKFLGLKD